MAQSRVASGVARCFDVEISLKEFSLVSSRRLILIAIRQNQVTDVNFKTEMASEFLNFEF